MIQVAIKSGKTIEYKKLPHRQTAKGHEILYLNQWVVAQNIDYTLTIEITPKKRGSNNAKTKSLAAAGITYEQWRGGQLGKDEKIRRPDGMTEWGDRLHCEKMIKKATGFKDKIFTRRQLRTGSYEYNRVTHRGNDARGTWEYFINFATCVIKAFSEQGGEWSYAREIIDEAYSEAQYKIMLIRG